MLLLMLLTSRRRRRREKERRRRTTTIEEKNDDDDESRASKDLRPQHEHETDAHLPRNPPFASSDAHYDLSARLVPKITLHSTVSTANQRCRA